MFRLAHARITKDFAEVGTVGYGAADRVEGSIADEEIVVGALGAKRIVGGGVQRATALPPAMLA